MQVMAIERKWPVCLLRTNAHQRQNEKETATAVISPLKWSAMLNVSLPALIDYVAFYQTVPVPHHYPKEGLLWNMTSWVVCDIQGLSLAVRLCCCCPHQDTPLLTKWSFSSALFPSSLPASPADTCLYMVLLLRSDMLNVGWRIPLKTSIHHPWEHS